MMAREDWRHVAGDPDTRHDLSAPWVVGDRIYVTDGRMGFAAPAARYRPADLPEPTLPADQALCVEEVLAPLRAQPGVEADLWRLMCWAGRLPGADVVCEACGGLGTVGWVASDDGGDLVGPDDERPGVQPADGCSECGGTGYWGSPVERVVLFGLHFDARLLARTLWALVRLGVRCASAEVVMRVGIAGRYPGHAVHLTWGGAEAVLMGRRPDGEPTRTWPGGTEGA